MTIHEIKIEQPMVCVFFRTWRLVLRKRYYVFTLFGEEKDSFGIFQAFLTKY